MDNQSSESKIPKNWDDKVFISLLQIMTLPGYLSLSLLLLGMIEGLISGKYSHNPIVIQSLKLSGVYFLSSIIGLLTLPVALIVLLISRYSHLTPEGNKKAMMITIGGIISWLLSVIPLRGGW